MNKVKQMYRKVPKTVFITGAMSGIGAELAKFYAQAGANIGLFDLRHDGSVFDTLQGLTLSSEHKIRFYQLDIREPDKVSEIINCAVREIGQPELAINCAGILRTASFSELNYDSFKQVVDINLMGSRNFAAAVVPHLQPGSHLVLIASLAGIVGTFTQAAYAASKFGVVGLAEVLRLELKPLNIDVSVICPGEISTPLLDEERRVGSPIAAKMNAFAGVLDLQSACQGILKGLSKRQFMVTPGLRAWFAREFAKKCSALFRKIADIRYRQARKSAG